MLQYYNPDYNVDMSSLIIPFKTERDESSNKAMSFLETNVQRVQQDVVP